MTESEIRHKPIGRVALPSGVLIIGDASLALHHLNKVPLSQIESGPVRESEGQSKSIFLGPETESNQGNAVVAHAFRGDGPYEVRGTYDHGRLIMITIDLIKDY